MANGKIYNRGAFNASPSLRAGVWGRKKFIWSFLKPAFDWGIAPTDIDGLVERNGNYLLYECKEAGQKIPTGQGRMLKDLNIRHGFTIFVVTGFNEQNISALNVIWPRQVKHDAYQNINAKFLLEKSRQWFDWADGNKKAPIIPMTKQEQSIREWLDDYERAHY